MWCFEYTSYDQSFISFGPNTKKRGLIKAGARFFWGHPVQSHILVEKFFGYFCKQTKPVKALELLWATRLFLNIKEKNNCIW